MIPFDIELKVFATFGWKTTQVGWRSKMHLMLWIIVSQPPLIATPNWCGEKCVTKASWNWRHKAQLCESTQWFPTTMGRIPLEGLLMAKRWAIPRMCAIWGGMWPMQCENKVGTTKGIHLLNLRVKTMLKVFKNYPKRTICR
jgi:hypothetical protein